MIDHKVFFSLGSNLGDKQGNIRKAISRMEEMIGAVLAQSSLYETAPWGFSSDNYFVNAAVCCVTNLSPHEVLEVTQQIERELGRARKSAGGIYHDRTIDIDILLYDDITVDTPELKIPHPLMHERDFVMQPLQEILSSLGQASME